MTLVHSSTTIASKSSLRFLITIHGHADTGDRAVIDDPQRRIVATEAPTASPPAAHHTTVMDANSQNGSNNGANNSSDFVSISR